MLLHIYISEERQRTCREFATFSACGMSFIILVLIQLNIHSPMPFSQKPLCWLYSKIFEFSHLSLHLISSGGLDSLVGIATRYGRNGVGVWNQAARFCAPVQSSNEVHPSSCPMDTGSPFRGQSDWGVVGSDLEPRLIERVELYIYIYIYIY